MKAPHEIIATLRDRDLDGLATEATKRHGVPLLEACTLSIHAADIVEARHAIWYALCKYFTGNCSAVARIFGAHPSTVHQAMRDYPPEIMRVVLARFPHDDAPLVELVWISGRSNPFGVVDASPLQSSTRWFSTHEEARADFVRTTEQSGAPTFRAVSVGIAHVEGGG